jgi:hypothetical protein
MPYFIAHSIYAVDLLDSADVKRTYESDLMGGTSDSSACVLARRKLIVFSCLLFFLCGFLLWLFLFLLYSIIISVSFSRCPYSIFYFISICIAQIHTNLIHWEKGFLSQDEKSKQGFCIFRHPFLNIQNFSTAISRQSRCLFLGRRRESRISLYIDRLVSVLHCAGFHCPFYSRKCYGHAALSGCIHGHGWRLGVQKLCSYCQITQMVLFRSNTMFLLTYETDDQF